MKQVVERVFVGRIVGRMAILPMEISFQVILDLLN